MRWRVRRAIQKLSNIDWSELTELEQAWLFRAMLKAGKNLQNTQGVSGDVKYLVSSSGYCHCCKQQAVFCSDDVWLRDHLACSSCGSTPRQRNLIRTLDELIPAWDTKVIHESSPGNEYFRSLPEYSFSQFISDLELGCEIQHGGTNQNLERLTFPDESFDIVITQDVMEHVFSPEKAMTEVLRVLRPGGWHIFTTPRHLHLMKSVKRASFVNNKIKYIKPAEYHGNPVGDGKALVTFDWGMDFESLVQKWTGRPVITRNERDLSRGIVGSQFEVFAVQK